MAPLEYIYMKLDGQFDIFTTDERKFMTKRMRMVYKLWAWVFLLVHGVMYIRHDGHLQIEEFSFRIMELNSYIFSNLNNVIMP